MLAFVPHMLHALMLFAGGSAPLEPLISCGSTRAPEVGHDFRNRATSIEPLHCAACMHKRQWRVFRIDKITDGVSAAPCAVARGVATVAMSASAAVPMVGGRELAWEPEKVPTVSPAAGKPQDWSGDLLVLAVPEDAIDTSGATD